MPSGINPPMLLAYAHLISDKAGNCIRCVSLNVGTFEKWRPAPKMSVIGVPAQPVAGAPVYQSSLRASEPVCSEKPWIQPNATNPFGNEARILTRCHAAFSTATTREQELT